MEGTRNYMLTAIDLHQIFWNIVGGMPDENYVFGGSTAEAVSHALGITYYIYEHSVRSWDDLIKVSPDALEYQMNYG